MTSQKRPHQNERVLADSRSNPPWQKRVNLCVFACVRAADLEEQGAKANGNEQSQGGSGLVNSPSRRLDSVGIIRGLSRAVSGCSTRTGSLGGASARRGGGTAADGQSGAGAGRGPGLVRIGKVQNKSRVDLLVVPENLVAGPAVGRVVPEGGARLEHGVAGADLAAVAADAAAGICAGNHELREGAGHGVEEVTVRVVAQAGAAVVDVAVPRAGLAVGDAGALPDVVVAGALTLEHDCRDWAALRVAESDLVGSIGDIGDLAGLAGTTSEDDGRGREEGDGRDEVRRDVHFVKISEK